jgi:hypothetical protein
VLALGTVAACGASFGQAATGLVQYRMDVATVAKSAGLPPERTLHLALSNPRSPVGTPATQTIPPALGLGASLQLQSTAVPPGGSSGSSAATGKVLLYWGCADTVRPNQPQTLSADTLAAVTQAGHPSDTLPAGSVGWPAGALPAPIARTASLVGQHTVAGDGLPADLQFSVPAAQDFMPELTATAQGGDRKPVTLSWGVLPTATASFWVASAVRGGDTVVWTSSELATTGIGMLDFPSAASVRNWLAQQVVLPPTQTRCTIPAAVLAGTQGALVQGVAYGPELSVGRSGAWSALLRVKSQTTLELGTGGKSAPKTQDKPLTPTIPGLPDFSGALKGLFGR